MKTLDDFIVGQKVQLKLPNDSGAFLSYQEAHPEKTEVTVHISGIGFGCLEVNLSNDENLPDSMLSSTEFILPRDIVGGE